MCPARRPAWLTVWVFVARAKNRPIWSGGVKIDQFGPGEYFWDSFYRLRKKRLKEEERGGRYAKNLSQDLVVEER